MVLLQSIQIQKIILPTFSCNWIISFYLVVHRSVHLSSPRSWIKTSYSRTKVLKTDLSFPETYVWGKYKPHYLFLPEPNPAYQPIGTVRSLNSFQLYKKQRKNCECCPRYSLFKGHNVIVNIVVLNCRNCQKCQVWGHKSPGLLFDGVV